MRNGIALLAAAGIFTVIWMLRPVPASLYDGIGLPPESYRYLQPPKGHKQIGPPTTAQAFIPITQGIPPLGVIATLENPPQAQLIVEQGGIRVGPGAKQVAFTIKAVPPPSTAPDGALDGNVYRFTAKADNGASFAFVKGKVRVNLRGTGQTGSPVIELYSGGHWTRLQTGQYLGLAVYAAQTTGLGDFALVFVGKGGAASGSGGTSTIVFIVIGGLAAVLAVAAILLVRLSRQGSRDVDREV